MKAIGKYLPIVKMVAKLITEYTYRVRGIDKAVPMRNRLSDPRDVLNMCRYVKVMDDALDDAKICESAAKTVLSSFNRMDIHYTCMLIYTLSPAGEENDGDNVKIIMEVGSNDEADDLEEGNVEQDEKEPWSNWIL
jgi:hypothetical protein